MIPYFHIFVKAFSLIFYKNKGVFCRCHRRNAPITPFSKKESSFAHTANKKIVQDAEKKGQNELFEPNPLTKGRVCIKMYSNYLSA